MPRGEKPFRFPADLMLRKLRAAAIIRLEGSEVTHVETEKRRMWHHRDLYAQVTGLASAVDHVSRAWRYSAREMR